MRDGRELTSPEKDARLLFKSGSGSSSPLTAEKLYFRGVTQIPLVFPVMLEGEQSESRPTKPLMEKSEGKSSPFVSAHTQFLWRLDELRGSGHLSHLNLIKSLKRDALSPKEV